MPLLDKSVDLKSHKMKRAFVKPNVRSKLQRNPGSREYLNGTAHNISDDVQTTDIGIESDSKCPANTLKSEIIKVIQIAKNEAMNTIDRIFKNATTKAVACIQRVDFDNAGPSEISTDVSKLEVCDFMRHSNENKAIGLTNQIVSEDSIYEQLDIVLEDLEDSQEALIKDNLNRYELYISDCVKATDLIAFFGPLSSANTKELRSIFKRNPVEATQTALHMIKEMKNQPKKYRLLLEALKDAGYPKIVSILNGTLIPVGSCHRNIIRQCASHIFQRLNTSEILPYLYSKSVISTDDKQQILQTEMTESTSIAALELLDMLPNRNKHWFKYFVESLLESGHEELARIVKGGANTQFCKEDYVIPEIPKTCQSLNQANPNDNKTSQFNDDTLSQQHELRSINRNLCQQTGYTGIQKKNEYFVQSSSHGENHVETNNVVKTSKNELSLLDEHFENQNQFPLSDSTSESSDDQSCVHAYCLDRGFDFTDNIANETNPLHSHFDMIECSSLGSDCSEIYEKGSSYQELSQTNLCLSVPSSCAIYDSDPNPVQMGTYESSDKQITKSVPERIHSTTHVPNSTKKQNTFEHSRSSIEKEYALSAFVRIDTTTDILSGNRSRSYLQVKIPASNEESKNRASGSRSRSQDVISVTSHVPRKNSKNRASDSRSRSQDVVSLSSHLPRKNIKNGSSENQGSQRSSLPLPVRKPLPMRYGESKKRASDTQSKPPLDMTSEHLPVSGDKTNPVARIRPILRT